VGGSGAHVHIEARLDGRRVNPEPLLEKEQAMSRGWHGGNERPMTGTDWQILGRVPPGNFVFLPGQGITAKEIVRIMQINPQCEMHMRPYYVPLPVTEERFRQYLDDCKRHMDGYRDAIPVGRRHLQPWNEQNMPRWAPGYMGYGEGFGDQLSDMQRFDEFFCRLYQALKAHDPTWRIGWTPLTIGNRDTWFEGDAEGHYYMHGPSGCRPPGDLTLADRQYAIRTGPCYNSLMMADEYLAHVYIHYGPEAWNEWHHGLRFARYQYWLPKPMQVWITEACYPNKWALQQPWAGDALVKWERRVSQFEGVAGHALWILGDHWDPSGMWYQDGRPCNVVQVLQDNPLEAGGPTTPPPPPPQPEPEPGQPSAPTVVLIDGFEGAFTQRGAGELVAPEGWEIWFKDGPHRPEGSDGPWYNFRPEYKPADIRDPRYIPECVHSGHKAVSYFTTYAHHEAGLMCRLAVAPGSLVTMTAWGRSWSSAEDNPRVSASGLMDKQIGIDPTGGLDPWAETVAWCPVNITADVWVQLQVQAQAQGGQVGLFLRTEPAWPVKHNDAFWDDVVVTVTPVGRPSDERIGAVVAEAIQAAVIPYNPAARLAQDGAARGFAPASDEFYTTVDGVQVVGQAWLDPAEAKAKPKPYQTQHIVWRVVGEWGEGQAHWVTRSN
jgi:hypothetical protein